MCKGDMHDFLQALPKCEHHLHIEGTLEPPLLFELAKKNNITLPVTTDPAFESIQSLQSRYSHWSCLDDFLHYYYIGMSVLLTQSDYEQLAWQYFAKAHEDGVRHAEIFFDPQAHVSRGVPYTDVVAGISKARDRAWKEFNLSSELICCFLRHVPVPECLALLDDGAVQNSLEDGSIRGIGLDSSELPFPPAMFKDVYAKACTYGPRLRRTAHAGEEAPPSYIAEALKDLEVERIDHGLQVIKDPELLSRVSTSGTMLTLCPVSNVVLQCVKELQEVPVRDFLTKGVKFSINSDDPAYFGGYIMSVYCKVQEAFELSKDDWKIIVRNGIEGSWCDDRRKADLLAELNAIQLL